LGDHGHLRFFPMDKELMVRFYLSLPGSPPQLPD
jgi:hypothetical protein